MEFPPYPNDERETVARLREALASVSAVAERACRRLRDAEAVVQLAEVVGATMSLAMPAQGGTLLAACAAYRAGEPS